MLRAQRHVYTRTVVLSGRIAVVVVVDAHNEVPVLNAVGSIRTMIYKCMHKEHVFPYVPASPPTTLG